MKPEKKPSIALGVFGGLALFFIGLPVAILLLFLIALVPAILGFILIVVAVSLCLKNWRAIEKEIRRVVKTAWGFIYGTEFETCQCSCGQRIEYPSHARGTEINCPACEQKLFCRPPRFDFRKAFQTRASKIYTIVGLVVLIYFFMMFPIAISVIVICTALFLLVRFFARNANL